MQRQILVSNFPKVADGVRDVFSGNKFQRSGNSHCLGSTRRRLARNQIIVVDSGVLISGEGLWRRGSALIAWKISFSRMAGLSAS